MRTVDEKVRGAMLQLRHRRSEIGLYELKRIVEKAALNAAINEATNLNDIKDILRYMVNK